MKVLRPFSPLSLVFFLAGCASLLVGSEFQSGRRAMLSGNDETALAYFQSVAQKDPNYAYGTAYRQGILSYLGRTEYSTGKLPQARQTLERALAANRQEDVARLYLGLTLVKSGDRAQGMKEIEGAMRGIQNWLDYFTDAHRFSYGQFWDPGRDIRSAIQTQLAMVSGREADTSKLIAEAEWLGKRMEEEVDRARDQETRQQSRENDGGQSGGSQP
jgi:tetratricopeptide (TPR) repeat protein